MQPKAKKLIILTAEENNLMQDYVDSCHYSGFTGINNYSRINEAREFFYRWHLSELIKKFQKSRGGKMIFLTLTPPELLTIKAMFGRVDCCDRTRNIQRKFIH